MKISFNIKFTNGPSGGGMMFANLFRDYLEKKGIEITSNIKDQNIDIIFHISPMPFIMSTASFSFLDAYISKLKHPKTIIIHRINECDERKNTKYMNKLIVKTAKYSDIIIFIASWLKPLLEKQGLKTSKPNKIILHGADENIFNTKNKKFWDGKNKLKLVTHHWGGNYLKGHDFYQRLDLLLDKKEFNDKFEFTYIGNYPKNLKYKNTKIIKPLSGEELAEELKRHDIYLTASRNEPAGMHHVEGALCGLPIMYINSGALREYCEGYGLEFDKNNFEDKLLEIKGNYKIYLEKVLKYNRTARKMLDNYYDFLIEMYEKFKNIEVNKKNNLKIFFYSLYSFLFTLYIRMRRKILR
jgi:hypothetical protein